MNKAIYFDMDGTIADLYGIDNWLELLKNQNIKPYKEAKPLLHLSTLARLLNKLQRQGYSLGVVTWLAKDTTKEYKQAIANEKKEWLKKHLKSVQFDEVHIEEYGTPKHKVVKKPLGILFDDELKNRIEWKGKAYNEKDIINILKGVR